MDKLKKKNNDKLLAAKDNERIMKEVEQFKVSEDNKKQEKILKNKKHLDQVIKQMSMEPKMFAKTGVAIIKNTNPNGGVYDSYKA